MGAVVVVGDEDCPKNDKFRLPCQQTGVDAPAGVRRLANALTALEKRMETTVPACAEARKW
jgi:hypothetical protein